MIRYRCLVLDHDDTVVRSEETVNFPSFQEALSFLRPKEKMTREEFSYECFFTGFFEMCHDKFHFTEEEHRWQMDFWTEYVRTHVPPPYEGIRPLLQRFRAEGGLICVSSHSGVENITRDYQTHFGFVPDQIFGWELGEEKRKPAPYALEEIMRIYQLAPKDLLMVDDMKPGYMMATACNVAFACAGWSHSDPRIMHFMRENSDIYLETTAELGKILFDGK